jgi:hypothetical protein
MNAIIQLTLSVSLHLKLFSLHYELDRKKCNIIVESKTDEVYVRLGVSTVETNRDQDRERP